MKLKKLYLSFICYLTLIAFIGIISLQISSNSKMQLQKQEVSANKVGLNSNLNLVFEEERDADDFLSYELFSFSFISSIKLSTAYFQNFITNYINGCNDLAIKIPLFIFHRTLRL
jgi:hypothetical protein